MPRTVKVPPQYDAIFDKAEEILDKFFADRFADPAKGTIEISGERFILIRAAALSIEFYQLIRRFIGHTEQESVNIAGHLLFDIAHALGKSDALHLHKSMALKDPVSKLSTGAVFVAHVGWTTVNILEESTPTPDENYYLLYDHPSSFEADAWRRTGKLSDFPVCFMNAGYSAGWSEAGYGRPMAAVEVSCRARGDKECRFIMAPPTRIGAHVTRYLEKMPGSAKTIPDERTWTSFDRNWAREALLERALQNSERSYRRLFEHSPDSIVMWGSDNIIQATNKATAALLGYESPDDLIGRNWQDFVVVEDLVEIASRVRNAHDLANPTEDEFRMQRRDGSRFFAEGRLVVVSDDAGRPIQTIAIARDITSHKTTEAALRLQALRDALTGLPNRPAFLERLGEAFASSKRGARAFAVHYLDVDFFKDVNDTLGHVMGDRFLQQVADRLRSTLRKADFVARLGGDEFAVLQFDLNEPSDAGVLAGTLTKAMAAPFHIDHDDVHVTISVGIAFYDPGLANPEAMLTQADLALYRAKAEGRDRYCFHASDLDRQVNERVALTNDLRAALDRGELEVHYQPQVEMTSGRIVGVEALARWHHPKRGWVSPELFVPIAEHSGLIRPLARRVLGESCRRMRQWRDLGIAPPVIAVNVSAAQFKSDLEFERDFAGIVAQWGLSPSDIELELTESVLLEATKEHRGILERFQQSGVKISIDDFGSGYSSLSYLRSYRFNRLKIGQQFIAGVPGNSGDVAITRATLSLARAFGIGVIAEGIETAEQSACLLGLGCEHAQGYYFARPLPADEVVALLRQGRTAIGSLGAT